MKNRFCYLFLALTTLLMPSCNNTSTTQGNSSLKYNVIEIDSCEYIILHSRTYGQMYVTSITHKGNCKYCKERRNRDESF